MQTNIKDFSLLSHLSKFVLNIYLKYYSLSYYPRHADTHFDLGEKLLVINRETLHKVHKAIFETRFNGGG